MQQAVKQELELKSKKPEELRVGAEQCVRTSPALGYL